MSKHRRHLIISVMALLGVLLTASQAQASRAISVEGGARSVAASGRLTFGNTPNLELIQIICDVTLLRTIGASISKTAGTLFGKVTGVAIDRGTGTEHCGTRGLRTLTAITVPGTHRELGGGVLLWDVSGARAELWKLIYDSFQGTLPRISGINFHIQRFQFLLLSIDTLFVTHACLYESDVFGLIRIEEGTARTAEVVLGRTTLRGTRLELDTSANCLNEALSGNLTITPNIRIRLV